HLTACLERVTHRLSLPAQTQTLSPKFHAAARHCLYPHRGRDRSRRSGESSRRATAYKTSHETAAECSSRIARRNNAAPMSRFALTNLGAPVDYRYTARL